MSRYTDEERAAMLARGRQAIADADETLAEPRPEVVQWPACETRSERWRREIDERERQFAAERAKSAPLTEWESAKLEQRLTAQIGDGLDQQKDFTLRLLAELVAELRAEFAQKVAEEVGQLRAEMTIAKAHAPKSGEIIDLPQLPLKRKRA